MKWSWTSFGGEIPRLEPHLLPDTGAQLTRNTRLYSGGLRPFRKPVVATSPASPSNTYQKDSIYLYDEEPNRRWLWSGSIDLDFSRGPTVNDMFKRVYVSQKGGACWVMGAGEIAATSANTDVISYPTPMVGVPIGGTTPPTVTLGGSATGVPTQIVVAFAYVDATGAVGALSAASTPVDLYPGQTIALSGMPTLTAAGPGLLGVASRNIYIAQTDLSGNAEFRYWANHPCNSSTLTATSVNLSLLGEAAASPSPLPAPSTLFNLKVHPNGFMYGIDISTNMLCRSQIYKPYSWPEAYRDPLRGKAIGAAVIGQSIVVMTDERTYLFIGQDPENLAKIDLDGRQICASKRSIVETTAGVVYASPDGLVLVTGNSTIQVITSKWFTRTEWQAMNPASMRCAVQDDRIHVFWQTESDGIGVFYVGHLIFEMSGGVITSVVRSGEHGDGVFTYLPENKFYYARSLYADTDLTIPVTSIVAWDAGTPPMTQTWRSKTIVLPVRAVIGAARVLSIDSGETATFRFYADGRLRHTKVVTSDRPFVLPAPTRYKEFYWEIESTSTITQVDVANTIGDLQS